MRVRRAKGTIHSLCILGVLSLLGACAALAPRDAGPRAEPFDVLGRVLVSHDGRSFSSSVRWQHGATFDELWLMTPTGQALSCCGLRGRDASPAPRNGQRGGLFKSGG